MSWRHSSVAMATPSVRTPSGPPVEAATSRATIHSGTGAPIVAIRSMELNDVTGMIPGRTGLVTPRAARSATKDSYSSAAKKNWVHAKSAISSFAAK